MNRNQIFTTIEFVDDMVKMSIGEYYNERFYVFDTFKCHSNGLESSNIVNPEEVKKTILDLLALIEEKTEVIVEEAILCMPTDYLIINDFASTSPVTGKNYLISQYDINESYKVASKIRHQDNEIIINIAPIEYQLDDNQKMDLPPLRYKSTTFKTSFKVYMLPVDVYNSYLSIISDCGIKVDKYYLDVDCLYSGVFDEDDISSSILNIGKYSTSLLIYKKGKLLNKYSISVGTSIIEKEIQEKLKIEDKKEVDNLIYNIGSCDISSNSYLNVGVNSQGKYVSEESVNKIIEGNMRVIFTKLFDKVKEYVSVSDLDVYITGLGGNIKNSDKLLNSLYKCNAIIFTSNCLGLYDVSYCATIGLIKSNYKKISQNKYINLQNNSYNDIMVDRDRDSKFNKFILDEDELD